jgi:hypothetical protein
MQYGLSAGDAERELLQRWECLSELEQAVRGPFMFGSFALLIADASEAV